MNETIIIALIACTLGFFNDANKPKQYSIELASGESENILIESNGKYACPTYCATNHVHTAIMCESDCGHHHDSYNVSSSLLSDEKILFNGKAVLNMVKVQASKNNLD